MIEIVSTFKERFNQALSIRNIKPVELSEKTGISESTISQYRSGYAKPKEDKLAVLSNVLSVNPVWLMGLNVPMDEEERARQIREQYTLPTEEEQEEDELGRRIERALNLLDAYENASPDKREMVDFALARSQHKS